MSDLLDKVLSDQDPFKKILGKIPGFKGYIERQSRRDADKLLRETIASRFETLWQRISALQREMISGGDLSYVDVLESAAIKLRTFADRIRSATYGYSSLFEAVKINEAELNKLYEYDLALLEYVDRIEHTINNIEASLGTDGLPAAVRALGSLARESIEAYDRREEVILTQ
jgi:hypothetical protein